MRRAEVRGQGLRVRDRHSLKLRTQGPGVRKKQAICSLFIFHKPKNIFTFHFSLFAFYLLLSSCTFLYLPPVLPEQIVEPTLDISDSSGLSYTSQTLELSIFLHTVPEEGWLNVQWFAPNNKEAASDAIWIEPRDQGLSQTFALPQIPSKGDWRVVVSFGDRLLRQFTLEVK